MKTTITLALSMLALVDTGRQAHQLAEKPKTSPLAVATRAESVPAGNWYERSVQCAQLAEKAAAREREKSQANGYEAVLDGWTNHYSLKYDRCFVLLRLKNPPKGAFPPSFEQLVDALENRSLALYSGHPGSEGFCQIKQGGVLADCNAAAAYIAERMDK